MKVFKNISLILLLVLLTSAFTGCTGNDDESFEETDLKSYIVGSWHSYRATVYGNNEKIDIDITKDNEYSSVYVEAIFRADGTATLYSWQPDKNNVSRWIAEEGVYTVSGNTVEVRDAPNEQPDENGLNQGIGFNVNTGGGTTRATTDSDVLSMMFDQKSRFLFVRASGTNEYGIDFVVNIYFRK